MNARNIRFVEPVKNEDFNLVYLVRPEQLETYKEYNIEPSFFTNHSYFLGNVFVKNLGDERAFFLSPIAKANQVGLQYTNHSDATVTPIDPRFTV